MPSLPPGSPPPERPKPPEGRRLTDYLSPAVLASLTPQARERMSRVRVTGHPDLLSGVLSGALGQPIAGGSYTPLNPGAVFLNPMSGANPETALHEGLHAINARPPEFGQVYGRSPELHSEFENIYGRTEDYARGPIFNTLERMRRGTQEPEEAFAAFGQRIERGEVPPWQVRWLYREVFTPDALRGPRTRVAGQMGARDIARRNEARGYAIPLDVARAWGIPANRGDLISRPMTSTLVPRPPASPTAKARME